MPRDLTLLLPVLALSCVADDSDSFAEGNATDDSFRKANPAADQGKVAICHRTGNDNHTIVVAAAAIPAHLGHGDTLGECASGCTTAQECGDGNACTTDTCLPDGTCGHAVVDCNDGNACTAESCEPATGCVSTPSNGVACEDGNECTDDDVCSAGACQGTAVAGCCLDAQDCNDGNACSDDVCTAHACTNTPVACADADPCVVGFCDPASGECDAVPVDCNDGNPCTADTCSAVGCAHAPNGDAACGTSVQVASLDDPAIMGRAWISGTDVAWSQDHLYQEGDVTVATQWAMHHDLGTTTTRRLTPDTNGYEIVGGVDDGVVSVVRVDAGPTSVVLHTLDSDLRRVVESDPTTGIRSQATIGDGLVAFVRRAAVNEPPRIVLYDLAAEAFLPHHPFLEYRDRPRVAGGWLFAPGNGYSPTLLGHEPASSTFIELTDTSLAIADFDTDGARVVYTRDGGGATDIFVFDIASGTTQILALAPSRKLWPRIDGDRVVWTDRRNADDDVWFFDLASGQESPLIEGPGLQVTNDFDGDRVLYRTEVGVTQSLAVFTFGGA